MKRRQFLQSAGVLAGLSILPDKRLFATSLFAAGEMTPVRRNVGYYVERGGTIGWLMTKEHLVVVDTQFPEQANNLLSRLRETNQKPVDLLINTHHHGDHTAGNVAFRGIVKTHVAHQNSHDNQKKVAEGRNALQNELLPSTTFTTSWSQIVGDEKITLYYWGAAHTNGDAVVHFENANVVHLGDLIFNRRFPFIDKTAGASIRNWVKVLKEVRKQFDKDTTFIFGHAGENRPVTGTKEDIKAMENYLTSLWKFGKQSRKQGKTLEQLKESTKVIQGASEWTGAGIERSLDAIWLELDGK